MKNTIYLNCILILVSFFTYAQKVSITLFENEKIKISFQDGAIKQKFHHLEKYYEGYDTISMRLFPLEKIYLGRETNKNFNLKAIEKKIFKKSYGT